MSILGTTGIHMRYVASASQLQLPNDQTGYTIAFPGGGYVQLQSNMAASMNLDWVLGLGANLDKELQNTVPSASIYHPYIATAGERGPFVNAEARASFIGLNQHMGYFDLVRSVVEGLGFAVRDCFEALGELPAEIRLTGGAAKSVSVQHILASVMNRPVRSVEYAEAAAAGAAMIASVKHGYFDSVDACVQQWLADPTGSAVQPTKEHTDHYDAQFQTYLHYRKTQPEIWSGLAAVRHD